MNRNIVSAAFVAIVLCLALRADDFDPCRELERANRETLHSASKTIEALTDAKLTLEVDAISFGSDQKAWSNLSIIANRIIGAFGEVGRDQVGKDAIDRDVKRVVIVKFTDAQDDTVELQDHTLFVRTSAGDKAMIVLQNRIVAALEKALQTGHPPIP